MGKCQSWFSENVIVPTTSQLVSNSESQATRLENIYLVDGSWTTTSKFNGCGWVWIDISEQNQLTRTKNQRHQDSALDSELEALLWGMENMLVHSTC